MRSYLSKTKPIPPNNRVPWFRYLGPCYGALFLWLGYFEGLAKETINRAPLEMLIFGIAVAGLLCYYLFFLVPARLGMQTGYPVGVLGSSTFGSRGGQFVPGLIVPVLHAVLLGVAAHLAARSIALAIGVDNALVIVLGGAVWALATAAIAGLGIGIVSKIALALGWLPLLVLALGVWNARQGLAMHSLDLPEPFSALTLQIQVVTGFFSIVALATPGLARYSSSNKEVRNAGLTAVVLPAVLAASLVIVTVAAARALSPVLEGYGYLEAVISALGDLGMVAPLLLAVAAIPVSAFFAWSASDSLRVMLPGFSKPAAIASVAFVGALSAAAGVARDPQTLITVLAAFAAPLCGIMVADYWQHDKRWPHTRPGVNLAGFCAWGLGVFVGLLPLVPMADHFRAMSNPAAVYGWVAGFVGYVVFGNLGLKPYRRHRRKRVRTAEWDEGSTDPVAAKASTSESDSDSSRSESTRPQRRRKVRRVRRKKGAADTISE